MFHAIHLFHAVLVCTQVCLIYIPDQSLHEVYIEPVHATKLVITYILHHLSTIEIVIQLMESQCS